MADTICQDLTVHTQIEKKLFYPAFHETVKDSGHLVKEALVEHQAAKDLIQDKTMDCRNDAAVKVLGEYVKHHVKEEDVVTKVRKTDIDLIRLSVEMEKQELTLHPETFRHS